MKEDVTGAVLLFHSVDDRDRLSVRNLGNVGPDVFERICRSIKSEFDVVDLNEFIGLVSEGGAGKGRFLSVTFDDGTKSYASIAAPIMAARGIPSTCFLITDFIGDQALYWRYLYNYCINAGHGVELSEMTGSVYGVPLKEEELIGFTRRHYDREKNRHIMEGIKRSIITEEQYRAAETDLFLSFDDLEKLKKDPLVSFGIHTRSHPVMNGLSGKEIADELSESIAFYRDNIENDAPMFSVPFGRLGKDYDERTVLAALELGIPAVFSAYGGLNEKGQPRYNLRRMPVTAKLLERGVDTFIRSLTCAIVSPEYIEREENLRGAVEGRRQMDVSHPKT